MALSDEIENKGDLQRWLEQALQSPGVMPTAVTNAVSRPRVLSGSVNESGSPVGGEGFTSERTEEGVYQVTLNAELPENGSMTATARSGGKTRIATVDAPAKKTFVVLIADLEENLRNGGFNFTVGI